jgi:hypothetical protein
MIYANVVDGSIASLGPRPKWLIGAETPEESRPLTDEELAEHGWFRILDAPQYDAETQKLVEIPQVEWAIGEGVVGPQFRVEPLTPEELADRFTEAKAAKRADLANIRWEHETGGINVDGLTVPTDRETQTIVDRLVKAFDDGDLTDPVSFKRSAGDWLTIDADTARLIKRLGAQHVQVCFSRECVLDGEIAAAADRAALNAIDLTQGWPA